MGCDRNTQLFFPKAPRNARLVLVDGIHDVAPHIADSALGGRVAGYLYPEYLAARGLTDSQESRRAWRAAK